MNLILGGDMVYSWKRFPLSTHYRMLAYVNMRGEEERQGGEDYL